MLDSWPVLEWIKDRYPVALRFRSLLLDLATRNVAMEMTRINYGEVIYTIRKAPDVRDRELAMEAFSGLPIRVHSIDDLLVDAATDLKSQYSFSFADAFAAALAIRLGVELITGDDEFRRLQADSILKLRWLGA